MTDLEPEETYEDEPQYPTMQDMPDSHRGPVAMPDAPYDADMLNFLQHTVVDSFYSDMVAAIDRATHELHHIDQLGGLYPRISHEAATKLKFLADKYVHPTEYVVTNIRDAQQYRSIINDFRMDAANTKVGLHRIDLNSTFVTFLSAMENHLKGAKLTRSYNGFERTTQQTTRAEMSSTYEQKKPPAPASGLSRLIGRG